MFFSNKACNNFLLYGCFLMVCEKKKYFLLGIKFSIGTSLTPKNTSQSEISLLTSTPIFLYSSSTKALISELSTFTEMLGCNCFNLANALGVNTTLLSGVFFLSFKIPNFIGFTYELI